MDSSINEKYVEFWEWFSDKEDYIYDHLEDDTYNVAFDLSEHLKYIHDDLSFEVSFEKENGVRTLIISADGIADIFKTVIDLCSLAPQYKRWNVIAFRPRLNQKNQIIELDDMKLDYNDIFFTYSDYGKYIDVIVYIKGYDFEDNRYIHTYFLLLDSLIGEFDAVTKIGNTTIFPLDDVDQEELLSFDKLIFIIDGLEFESVIES